MAIRIEFVYHPQNDTTTVYIWDGITRVLDHRNRPGKLSSYDKTLIKKELLKEFKDYKE